MNCWSDRSGADRMAAVHLLPKILYIVSLHHVSSWW